MEPGRIITLWVVAMLLFGAIGVWLGEKTEAYKSAQPIRAVEQPLPTPIIPCDLCGRGEHVVSLTGQQAVKVDLCLNCVTCLRMKGEVQCEAQEPSAASTSPQVVAPGAARR